MSTEDQEKHDHIIEQLRARSSWQSQQTGSWPAAPEQASHAASQRGSNQSLVFIIIGVIATLIMIVLLISASGKPGGGADAGGAPGPSATPAALTQEAAAEAAGRFWLALLAGDRDVFEDLVDPGQKPVPADIQEFFDWRREEWQEWSPTSSMGWRDGAFVVELAIAGPPRELLALHATSEPGDSGSYVMIELFRDGEFEDSIEVFMVPSGTSWVVQSIEGLRLWDYLDW